MAAASPPCGSLDWHASARAALLRARTEAGHWEGGCRRAPSRPPPPCIALATAARHDSGVVAHPSTARRHDSGVVGTRRSRARRASVAGRARQHATAAGATRRTAARTSRPPRSPGARSTWRRSTPAIDAAARKAEAWLTYVAGGVDGGSLRRALDAPLRLGPHLLGADPHGAGDRRAPADPGATSRSCRSSWRRPRISCSRRCGCRW